MHTHLFAPVVNSIVRVRNDIFKSKLRFPSDTPELLPALKRVETCMRQGRAPLHEIPFKRNLASFILKFYNQLMVVCLCVRLPLIHVAFF